MSDTYEIRAIFYGLNEIRRGYATARSEAQKTTRTILSASRQEANAGRRAASERISASNKVLAEKRRAEREATREAIRAVREVEVTQRRMYRERQRLQREDTALTRLNIQAMRKQEQELQQTRSRALRMMATGGAGLIGMGAGLKVAGNLEDAMTDLRTSITRLGADGAVDMQLLNSQMAELESLAIRLGNSLPGSTEEFVRLFIAMREGGIEAKTILEGAGDAAANLAVVSKIPPQELGKVFAQLGTMGKLDPKDYTKTADLLARLRTATGSSPVDLIEGAKYSIPRGGMPLGLTGYSGLEANLKLLALGKRYGQEVTIGGTGLSALFSRLTFDTKAQQKKVAELRGKGIDLKFFDKKGAFLGVENMVAQMEKLNKLSQKDKISTTLRLFEREGSAVAQALADIGTKGYAQFAEELERVLSLTKQTEEEQGKFNVKVENLAGTFSNVVAKTFTPAMEALKVPLDLANKGLGILEGFAREHPTIAKYATSLFGVGSAALVVSGAFKAATTSLRLMRLTSRISRMKRL